MGPFQAFRIHDQDGVISGRLEAITLDALSPGDVVIEAHYSSVNYKDALAGTGKGKILRRFPLVGGIDVAGVVVSSDDARFQAGAPVLVTGCGLSEEHDGGYAEYARVPADWVIALPAGLTLHDAMALGTAGFTAALAVQRLEDNGQRPDQGPVIVTGASGGVGSLAVDMLAKSGYEVVALSGKPDAAAYLKELGAHKVLDRHALDMGTRPLEQARWGGAVDTAGGATLGWLTRTVRPWGNIASIGLAGGTELHTTVMPFILRGVSLLGIDSVHCPMPLRRRIWERLGSDLRPPHLDRIVAGTVGLGDLLEVFERVLAGHATGRTVVRIQGP